MRRTRHLGFAATLLLLGAPGTVRAEPGSRLDPSMPSSVRLLLPSCAEPPLDLEDFVAVLRIELLEHAVVLDGVPGEAVAVVAVDAPSCREPTLEVRILSSATDRTSRETVDLADSPRPDRGRVLALAVAELLERSWASLASPEPDGGGPTAPEPAGERPPAGLSEERVARLARRAASDLERRRIEATDRRPRLLMGAMVGARSYPLFGGATFGPRTSLSVRVSPAAPLRLGFDLGYGFGGVSDPLGRIETHATGGSVAVLWTGGGERVQGEVGARGEIAWVRAIGTPADRSVEGATLDGTLVAVSAEAVLRIRLAGGLWSAVALQAGYVVLGLEVLADDRRVGGLGGPVLGLDIGLLFAP